MEQKTQSIDEDIADIVPLAIHNKIEETKHDEAANFSLPPLPIKSTNELPNEVKTPIKSVVTNRKHRHYASPSPSRSLSRPHHMILAAHLRPPPPLTPMSSIASDGSVIINEEIQNIPPPVHTYAYYPPPPPPPHDAHTRNDSYDYNMDKPYDYSSGRKDIKNIIPRKPNNHAMYQNGGRFFCNICSRAFGGKQHFEYHMRTHSGEKPFKCQTCGKAFRAKHSLKNHSRIHTGERPYQCKFCGKWFRQLGVMKNHIKNLHSH